MKSDEQMEFFLKVLSIKCQDKLLAESRELNERAINFTYTIQMLSELFQTTAHFVGFNNKRPK
jgi:hypothetical protein